MVILVSALAFASSAATATTPPPDWKTLHVPGSTVGFQVPRAWHAFVPASDLEA